MFIRILAPSAFNFGAIFYSMFVYIFSERDWLDFETLRHCSSSKKKYGVVSFRRPEPSATCWKVPRKIIFAG